MIARARNPTLACHALALIVLVAHQIDLTIRAGALASPNTHRGITIDDHIPAEGPLGWLRANHLAKGSFILATRTRALDAKVARCAAAHISLVANIVYAPIGAGAEATPHPNIGPHDPVDHMPRLLLPRMVLAPLLRKQEHVRAFLPRAQFGAFKHAAQDIMSCTEPVIRNDVAILLDVHAKLLPGADGIVFVTRDARKVHSKALRASAHDGGEPSDRACRITAQLHRRPKLAVLVHLPFGRFLPIP